MNEYEAIAQLKRGDIRGLEILVRKYQLDAIRIAAPITGDLGQAEEIVQEAFIKVYHNIDKFDAERSFRSWFMRIVVNDALNLVKYQHRFVPIEDPDIGGEQFRCEKELDELTFEQMEFSDDHYLAKALQEVLMQLSPEHRAVIQLKYYLAMSEEEIADVIQVPLGTVKSRLHTAKQKFKCMLIRNEIYN
jgi:RNA polymerase sigma-70 factor (ECF subfamily)